MPIALRSHCRSITARAFAISMAGALAGCGRGERSTPAGESAVADTTAMAATPAPPAPPGGGTPNADSPGTFTTPLPPLAGRADASELVVLLEPVAKGDAPAELLVTDPRGRRTGVEPVSLRSLMEIPYATYDSAPPPPQTDTDPPPGPLKKQFDLITPTPGRYTVLAVGRRSGSYSLVVRLTTPRGEVREGSVRDVQIRSGEVHRFGFVYDAESGALTLARQ